jgi:hypothetical protein
MIQILGENYYIDLDQIEKYLDITEPKKSKVEDLETLDSDDQIESTEIKVNLIKFDLVKMLLDTVLTENELLDDKLGVKSGSNTSIPFKLAFNSLLNKKFINHY